MGVAGVHTRCTNRYHWPGLNSSLGHLPLMPPELPSQVERCQLMWRPACTKSMPVPGAPLPPICQEANWMSWVGPFLSLTMPP